MAGATQSAFERRLAKASKMLSAVSTFLEHVAAVLRHVVHVAGWIVLLAGSVELLTSPHLSFGHFAVSGAGALAVAQGLIKPKPRQDPDTPADEPPSAPVLTVVTQEDDEIRSKPPGLHRHDRP